MVSSLRGLAHTSITRCQERTELVFNNVVASRTDVGRLQTRRRGSLMRSTRLIACLFVVACGGGGGTSNDMNMGDDMPPDPDGGITPPVRGFQIKSPPQMI